MSDARKCQECSVSIDHMGPRARFCGNTCNQAYWRRKKRNAYVRKPKAPRLNAAPLRELIETRCKGDHDQFTGALNGHVWIIKPEGEVARAWDRMCRSMSEKSGTIDIDTADLLAVKLLGMHPANVYGDEWWEAATLQEVA